jgi:hypothetical protein
MYFMSDKNRTFVLFNMNFIFEGRATVQAVTRGPVTAEARI